MNFFYLNHETRGIDRLGLETEIMFQVRSIGAIAHIDFEKVEIAPFDFCEK